MSALRFDFPAEVSSEAKLTVDRSLVKAALHRLAPKRGSRRLVLSLEPFRSVRSTRQNRYWFGVVVKEFGDLWSKGRKAAGLPGYTQEQVHDVLVEVILGFEEGPIPGTRVRKPTRSLSTLDFEKLADEARHIALHDYGMEIPLPNELRAVSA